MLRGLSSGSSLSHSARSYGGRSSNSGLPRHSLQQWIDSSGKNYVLVLTELKEFGHLGEETWKEVEDIGKIEECDILHNKIRELQIVLGLMGPVFGIELH